MYVDELPKSCWECPCFKNNLEFPCGLSDGTQDYFKDEIDGENCPLKSIKTHDRELVKKVCEKIREYLRTQVIYCGGQATELDIMIASASNQILEDVKQFLDQIQKEFEK